MPISKSMYKAARITRTAEQVGKGRGVSRARNIAVGKAAAKAGLFSALWGAYRRKGGKF